MAVCVIRTLEQHRKEWSLGGFIKLSGWFRRKGASLKYHLQTYRRKTCPSPQPLQKKKKNQPKNPQWDATLYLLWYKYVQTNPQKEKITNWCFGFGGIRILYIAGGNVKWHTWCGKHFGGSSKDSTQNYDMTQHFYPKYIPQIIENSDWNRYLFILIFIATLFKKVKVWKQPKCPLRDEWVNKIYICLMEYSLAE